MMTMVPHGRQSTRAGPNVAKVLSTPSQTDGLELTACVREIPSATIEVAEFAVDTVPGIGVPPFSV